MTDIPVDDRKYAKLLQKVSLRYLRSIDFFDEDRENFRRHYRWWRQVEEDALGGDEGSIRLAYAFAIVERMHAKITEPLFQMGLPFAVYPHRLGDLGKAKNMEQIARTFYGNPNFQEALGKSKKEMCIVGHRWEFDQWLHIERRGKIWGKEPRRVQVPVLRPDGTPVMGKDGNPAMMSNIEMVDAEIVKQIPVHYGFDTDYPSYDNVHPEPYRTTIDTGRRTDMSWIIRDLGYLALEDMAREMTVDPTTKATVPLYDFSRLLHGAGKKAEDRYDKIMRGESTSEDPYGALIQPIRDWNYQGGKYRDGSAGHLAESQALEDRDKIWVVQHRENGEILTVAQGKYIIHRKLDPFHVPGLKCRIENYTTDPDRLYGKGAIGPLEGELGQLDDIHALGMQNIFRLVNKMLYVREDAIVSEDDFDPRAGGRVRIRSDQADVRMAVADASQSSPINEMIAVESDLRGLLEFESMELDGSPGVMGTKQSHKTAKGQQGIINNMSASFSRWQRQARINECRRGLSMSNFFSQFAFEKISHRYYRPDGTTVFAEFNKDDIDTQGRSFDFLFNNDPQWGDLAQKRSMKLEIYQESSAYEKQRLESKDPTMRKVNLDILFEDILQESGYTDTSRIFSAPGGEMDPSSEYAILAQGGTLQGCRGDLQVHVTQHLMQLSSPGLKQAIEAGKASKDTPRNLQLLIQQALAQMKHFLQNPQGAADQKMGTAMGTDIIPGGKNQ